MQVLEHTDFSNCSVWAQELHCRDLVTPWHVGSSQARDQICIPCTDKQTPNP